eukprot:6190788-Pleurochrysis_carterae.AAC.1
MAVPVHSCTGCSSSGAGDHSPHCPTRTVLFSPISSHMNPVMDLQVNWPPRCHQQRVMRSGPQLFATRQASVVGPRRLQMRTLSLSKQRHHSAEICRPRS